MGDEPSEIPLSPERPARPEHVVGRDGLIEAYWAKLAYQSLVLVGPRGVGKRSLVGRMAAHPPEHFVALRWPLAQASSIEQAVELLEAGVCEWVPSYSAASGDWRARAIAAIAALVEFAEGEDKLVVLISADLRVFMRTQTGREGHERIYQLLRELCAMRQRWSGLRMLFAGGSGVVAPRFDRQRFSIAFDDVSFAVVPPLDDIACWMLLGALPLKLGGDATDDLIDYSEGHPLLIHLLVDALEGRESIDEDAISEALKQQLEAPDDPLELSNELALDRFFGAAEVEIARGLLDAVARSPNRPLVTLASELDGQLGEDLCGLARTLVELSIFVRESGRYRFRYEFVRRAWERARALEASR